MWNYSSVNDKWEKRVERLDKRIYNYLRQEIEDVRFYSKCLKGISYTPVPELQNLYDVLSYKTNDTFKINKTYSSKFNGTDITGGIAIKSGDLSEKGNQYRYNEEYGHTLKNLFTPKKIIDDATNYLTVDVATTDPINLNIRHREIDGVKLKEGHRVLVKNNITSISINSNIDPDIYFNHNYYFTKEIGNTSTYFYFNEENGIYKIIDGKLNRESDLDKYRPNIRYSVHVKLGTNSHKQFFLSRLKNGNFPLTSNSDPIEFKVKENHIVRNSLEYKNTLDNKFCYGITQKPESVYILGKKYQIPKRFLAVGDFGMILNFQDSHTNVIKNKFKEDLKDITSLSDKYLTVGNNGTLLSLSKLSLEPTYIDIDTFDNLNSVNFIDNFRGSIVGDNGSIFITRNQKKWDRIDNNIDNNLNKVLFRNLSSAIIAGDNGIVNELTLFNNRTSLKEIELIIKPNLFDEKRIREDLTDVDNIKLNKETFKFDGTDWVDLNKNIGGSDFSFDFRFKPTNIGTQSSTLFSFLTDKYPNTSGVTIDKGIKVIIEPDTNGVHRVNMYVNGQGSNITQLVKLNGNVNIQNDIWYHIMVTRDKGVYRLFINQNLSDSTIDGFDGNFDNFNNRIRLGSELTYTDGGYTYSPISYNHFEGVIDGVRFYNKTLNDTEVISHSNNYTTELNGLISWYKFNSYRKDIRNQSKEIRVSDVILNTPIILPSGSNLLKYNLDNSNVDGIDTEILTGIAISGYNVISMIIDIPENYSNQPMNNQLFINLKNSRVKNITYNKINNSLYGIGNKLFRIDIDMFEFDLFNQINVLDITEEIIIDSPYNNISLDQDEQSLYLISGTENQIDSIDIEDICTLDIHDPLENCNGSYITISHIGNDNGLIIENNYRNDVNDTENTNSVNYIKVLGYNESPTQSVVDIPVELNGNPLDPYTELYCSFNVSNLMNGHFEFSMDGTNYTKVLTNGDHLIPLMVGTSILRIRAVLDIENPIGNKVKGLIKNITFYEKDCVSIDPPKSYNGGSNIQKLYFSQFDTQSQLNKLNNGELYSYIDIKSLEINGIEQINLGTYSTEGFPKYLYPSDFSTKASVKCGIGGLCDYISYLANPVVDRIRYGFGLEVNGYDYNYTGDSYGLLEGMTINTIQTFGIDRPNVVNNITTINNPYHIGIDFTKSFRFEVDSMILDPSDLLFDDITNGNGDPLGTKIEILSSSISYVTASNNYFNEMEFDSDGLTYSTEISNIDPNRQYYVEMFLDGEIELTIGSQSFSFTGTGSIVNDIIEIDSNNGNHNIITLTNTHLNDSTYLNNFVITDRIPTKNIIEWDPDTCTKSYRMNGVEQIGTGFIQPNGLGEYIPSCKLETICDNSDVINEVIGEEYWNKYTSKLLFLNYDIASKLYFFDVNSGEYQLPNSVEILDISKLKIDSISGQKSWLDYSKDSTKDFRYLGSKSDTDTIKYNSEFIKDITPSSYTISLDGNSTNDINNINGSSSGLLPNYWTPTSTSSPTPPPLPSLFGIYFYDNYMIIKNPIFNVKLGDIIRIENSLIKENLMVIYEIDMGGNKYVYLKTTFSQSLTNRLISWNKQTKITNLNRFRDTSELLNNFNLHPISVGYTLSDLNGGKFLLEPNFNFKTSYYNLQCKVSVTNDILNNVTQEMKYKNKVLNFGYSARYNILDYLSKNPKFNANYKVSILPSYNFINNNNEVLYDISSGNISFNSSLKSEWESIPKHTFLDLIFGTEKLESILVLNKFYSEEDDRYIIETYNNFTHVHDPSDLNSSNWTLRVRNTLGEISSDLQKLDNIQKSESISYYIKDLNNNVLDTYKTLKSELNFKPTTDSYAKALLNQKEIKEYLTGIIYTDYKNELAVNMINLPECNEYKVTGISRYDSDCDDCEYDDYTLFENNNNWYNQFFINGTYSGYTNRTPFENYGYYNNILISSTSSTTPNPINVPIKFDTQGTTQSSVKRTFEFKLRTIVGSYIEIVKGGNIIHTIHYIPSVVSKIKIDFDDDGDNDLILRIHSLPDVEIDIIDLRVGNEECLDNCYLTKLYVDSHNLSIGDGIVVDIDETIYNLDNLYLSDFNVGLTSGWIQQDTNGTTSSVPISNGIIDLNIADPESSIYLPDSFSVSIGDTYRVTFDYQMSSISGTPSISPSFGTSSNTLDTNFETLYSNNVYTHVVTNFIPTSNDIYIGFNIVGVCDLKLSSISIDKIEDVGEYYDGYRVVQDIINSKEIVINTKYNGTIEELSATYSYTNRCGDIVIGYELISNLGTIRKCTFDPYLNYQPIDIFELGIDDKVKYTVEIKPNDWVMNKDNTFSILDTIDMNNYRFRLVDNLSIVELNDKYPWILESEIRKAVIGKDENGIVWYKGIWDCGRWFGGTWYSGDWRSGEWYDGNWYNSDVEDNIIRAEVKVLNSDITQSVWHNGNFRDGTWNGGLFRNGNHYNGEWVKGTWNGGTWHDGIWNSGNFRKGTWIRGTWNDGNFNCSLGLSSWFDGNWNDGNFECGIWYNGRFNSKKSISNFGSGSTLSRPSIWEGGQFVNGTFGLNNSRHDLSIWKTGYWSGGTWENGTTHQITWNNGIWKNGVVKDIDVVSFYGDSNGTYFFTLRGDWKFKKGDSLWIIDNNENSPIYGTDQVIGQYKVDIDHISINEGEYTKVIVAKVPISILNEINNNSGVYAEGYIDNNTPTDETIIGDKITSIVSHFSKTEWYNGQFKNGIFDGTFFKDGIWEKGSFKSGNFGY